MKNPMKTSAFVLFPALAVLALGACSESASPDAAVFQDAKPEISEAVALAPPAAPADADAEPTGTIPSPPGAAVAQLAYSYRYGIEAPYGAVAGLLAKHEAACRDAGPAVCQITGSSVQQAGEKEVSGQLTLRARPDWLQSFRDGLARDAGAAGGRLISSETYSEDLSRQIVDTEARLRAKSTLRDRLQALLATRPGKLSDLLELEQSLAQVQGEIDAERSTLEMMRQRVATSALSLDYRSQGVLGVQGAWAPVGDAVRASQGVMANTVGVIILLVAVLAPLSVVAALALYLGRLIWKRRKKAKAGPAKGPAAP